MLAVNGKEAARGYTEEQSPNCIPVHATKRRSAHTVPARCVQIYYTCSVCPWSSAINTYVLQIVLSHSAHFDVMSAKHTVRVDKFHSHVSHAYGIYMDEHAYSYILHLIQKELLGPWSPLEESGRWREMLMMAWPSSSSKIALGTYACIYTYTHWEDRLITWRCKWL